VVAGAEHDAHFGAGTFLYAARHGGTVSFPPFQRAGDSTPTVDDPLRERRARTVGYLIPCLWYAEEAGLDPLGDSLLADPDAAWPSSPAIRIRRS
jgi:hypothetical protein